LETEQVLNYPVELSHIVNSIHTIDPNATQPLSPVGVTGMRVHSHGHWCESEYQYMGSSKHEFTRVSMVSVHIDTSSVRVGTTCEFHSYEQFPCRSCFCPTHIKWTTQNLC